MLIGFEDKFMDAQARIISLCIELLETSNISADKIYVYFFQNEAQDFINAFFEKDKKIYSLNEWFSYEEIDEFFDCGIEDVENIIDICNTYESKCPNVFKLIYNIKTKAFDSNYEYEDIISEKDCDLIDEFEKWKKICRDNLTKY